MLTDGEWVRFMPMDYGKIWGGRSPVYAMAEFEFIKNEMSLKNLKNLQKKRVNEFTKNYYYYL